MTARHAGRAVGLAGRIAVVLAMMLGVLAFVTVALPGVADAASAGCTGMPTRTGGNLCVLGRGSPVWNQSGGSLASPAINVAGDIFINGDVTSSGGTLAGGQIGLTGPSVPSNWRPAPQPNQAPQADPFAGLPFLGDCSAPPMNNGGTGTRTLNPGTYASLTVSAGNTLTLNPGVYTLTGDLSNSNGGGTINGTDVTIYFCGNAKLDLSQNNNGTMTLSAPGGVSGLLFFFDRANIGDAINDQNNNSGVHANLTGIIYAPNARLYSTGGNSSAIINITGDVVVGRIYWSGAHVLNILKGPLPVVSLEVTKTPASLTLVAGGVPATYTLSVKNTGTGTANNVVLSDTLPASLTFVPPLPDGCTAVGQVISCDIGSLGPDGTATRDITVTAPAGAVQGDYKNTALATADDTPEAETNADVIVNREFAVSIAKAGPATVTAGDPLSYTLTVTNAGPSDADVTVTDSLPSGLTATGISVTSGAPLTCVLTTLICTGTLPAGGSSVITITANSSPDLAAGTVLINTGRVETEGGTNTSTDTESSVDTTVDTLANLTLTKTLLQPPPPGPIVAGTTVIYQLTVGNTGPSLATGVTITDTLPPGTTFVASSSSAGCVAGPPVVCSVGDLEPGQTKSFQIAVAVPSSTPAPGPLVNSATADSTTPNNHPSADDSTPVTQESDVTIAKTVSADPVPAGGPISYMLRVTNNGPSDATNVTVTDTEPPGVTFTGATGTGGFNCGTVFSPMVTCTLASLPLGTQTITITGTVSSTATPGSIISNTAVVDVGGVPVDQDTADTTVTAATALQLTKTASSHVVTAGGTLSYTMTVTNDGPLPATGVTLTDSIPSGFVPTAVTPAPPTCTFTATTLTCHLGTVAASGGTATVTLTGTVNSSVANKARLQNTATVTDDQGGSATADQSVKVIRRAAFTITKTPVTNPVTAGGTASWTITVTNTGPSDYGPPATPLTVTDSHSPEVTLTGLTSTASNVTCSGATACEINSLAAGQTVTITATGLVHSDTPTGTSLPNTATVETPTGPQDAPSTVDVVRSAALKVTKSAPATVAAGSTLNYVITVENLGPSDTTGTTVTDTLPAGLTFTGETPPCTATGQNVTCTIGVLTAGSSTSLTITADVSVTATGTLRNTAVGAADDAPPTDSNETDTVVTPDADVTIAKAPNEVGIAGQNMSWLITVLNQGPSPASGVTVTDTLPPGLGFVSATSTTSGVTCTGSGAGFSCTLPVMAASTAVNITLVTSIPADIIPVGSPSVTVTNAATVHLDGESKVTEAPGHIKGEADLTASKSATPNPVVAGTQVTFTLTVTNHGPSDANDVFIEDPPPPGLTFVATGSDARCVGVILCRVAVLAPGQAATFNVVALVDPSIPPGTTLVNVSTVGSDQENPNTGPTASATIQVVAPSTAPAAPAAPVTPGPLPVTGMSPSLSTLLQTSLVAIAGGLVLVGVGGRRRRPPAHRARRR